MQENRAPTVDQHTPVVWLGSHSQRRTYRRQSEIIGDRGRTVVSDSGQLVSNLMPQKTTVVSLSRWDYLAMLLCFIAFLASLIGVFRSQHDFNIGVLIGIIAFIFLSIIVYIHMTRTKVKLNGGSEKRVSEHEKP